MRKLYLHIGLGKTGSSALQSWLSLNADKLAHQGIDYADTVPEIKFGESLSGNGSLLHHACVAQDFDRVEQLLTSTYFFTPGNTVAIVSCELLQGLRLSTIEAIKEICTRNDIEVTVIAYVRSVYEWLYSTYTQFVKRSSHTHSFGAIQEDLSFVGFHEYLSRYFEVFGEHMCLLNYDVAKRDIYASFASVTSIAVGRLKPLNLKVNRSLTFQEVETLRRMNALHGGAFSTQISNYIIAEAPNTRSSVYYDPVLVNRVRRESEEAVKWINDQFDVQPPVVSDVYPGNASGHIPEPGKKDYWPVVQWALSFEPRESQETDFVSFLKDFAVLMVQYSGDAATSLIERASKIQLIIDQRDVEVPAEPLRVRVPISARFLMSYFHDVNAPEIYADGSSFSDDFYAWLELIEPSTVGSTLCPLEDTRVLQGSPSSVAGDKPPMSGYSIIEADDIDMVVALAEKCPLLDIGGVVEVSHVIPLNQAYATQLVELESQTD